MPFRGAANRSNTHTHTPTHTHALDGGVLSFPRTPHVSQELPLRWRRLRRWVGAVRNRAAAPRTVTAGRYSRVASSISASSASRGPTSWSTVGTWGRGRTRRGRPRGRGTLLVPCGQSTSSGTRVNHGVRSVYTSTVYSVCVLVETCLCNTSHVVFPPRPSAPGPPVFLCLPLSPFVSEQVFKGT